MTSERMTVEELREERERLLNKVMIVRWRHCRTGTLYFVSDVVFLCHGGETRPAVVYHEVEATFENSIPFCRLVDEFLGRFTEVPLSEHSSLSDTNVVVTAPNGCQEPSDLANIILPTSGRLVRIQWMGDSAVIADASAFNDYRWRHKRETREQQYWFDAVFHGMPEEAFYAAWDAFVRGDRA